MPKKIKPPTYDDHGLIAWIEAMVKAGKEFHTGELLGLIHGFPGAAFRDSEVARKLIGMVAGYLVKAGKIQACGERWSDCVFRKASTRAKRMAS